MSVAESNASDTSPAGLYCVVCHQEAAFSLRFCRVCGTPLAVNRNWLQRANLDFLLEELGFWQAEHRIAPHEADALRRDYSARRSALDAPPPVASPIISEPAALEPEPAELVAAPAVETPEPVRARLRAFLEERNIALLHVVGSLLLLAGLVVLVGWQWATWGKGILLTLLLALTAGLIAGGRRLSGEQPVSGRILCGLGALIAPLCVVAANSLGIAGQHLQRDGLGLVTAALCGGLYTYLLRRDRHPLFAGLLATAGAAGAWFLARLVLGASNPFVAAVAWLPTAALYFWVALRLRRAGQEPALARTTFVGAQVLMTLAIVVSGAQGPLAWRQEATLSALLALATAGLYGAVALGFRIPLLGYPAALAAALAGQLLVPPGAPIEDRAVAAVLTALLLWASGHLHLRLAPDDETGDTAVLAASIYHQAALLLAALTALPFAARLTTGYLAPGPASDGAFWGKALFCLGGASVLFVVAARREDQPALLYPALLGGLLAAGALAAAIAPADLGRAAPAPASLLFVIVTTGIAFGLRRRGQEEFVRPCEHVAWAATVLFALLPWLYEFAAGSGDARVSPAVRDFHHAILLPSLTLVAALAAFGSGTVRRAVAWTHAASVVLGSLGFLLGATAGAATPVDRALHAALGGAVVALVAAISAVFAARRSSALRSALGGDAAVCTGLAGLLLLPVLLSAHPPLAAGTVLCVLTTAWVGSAAALRSPGFLYPAIAALLLAGWTAANPMTTWSTTHWGWEPNPTRWLLVFVPLLAVAGRAARTQGADDSWARPGYYGALAALLWTGGAQLFLLGSDAVAASAQTTLGIIALGMAFYGAAAQRTAFASASLAPATIGYGAFLFRVLGNQMATGAVSPWLAAGFLLLFGACCLWIAWERNAALCGVAGGLALFAAWGHLVHQVLPPALHSAWPLALIPIFAAFFALSRTPSAGEDSSSDGLRTPMHGLMCALPLVCLILFLGRHGTPRADLPNWLTATTLAYGALYIGAALRRRDTAYLGAAVAALSAGTLYRIAGFPAWTLPAPQTGFWLAVFACGALGVAPLLARFRWWEGAETITRAALTLATLGAAIALAGLMDAGDRGRWIVYALALAGTVYAAVAQLRGGGGWRHAAFGAYFAAGALLLYSRLGFSLATADFYLIPIGLYLIATGGWVARARSDAAGKSAARQLYAAGLLVALTPTLLAVWRDTAWWHSFLLAGECVAAVLYGIAQRIRVFVGISVGFLVTLLALKLHASATLLQVHWGIYLTLMGAALIACAVVFDRRKAELARWTEAARAVFEGWE